MTFGQLPVLLIAILILTSCKKDSASPTPTPETADYSHLEGNYLIASNDSLSSSFDDSDASYDKIISFSVSNDTLFALGTFFLINSETQTVFHSYAEEPFVSGHDYTITFSNNFNSIHVDTYDFQHQIGLAEWTKNIDGVKTTLSASGNYHPDAQTISGLYEFNVYKKDLLQSIDTAYLDTLDVVLNNGMFELDQFSINATRFFRTYLNSRQRVYTFQQEDRVEIYWDQIDSLYIRNVHYSYPSPATDSLVFEYKGRKL